MEQEKYVQTLVMGLIFFVTIGLLGFIEQTYFSGAFTNPTLVGVALVPILFFLVVTGHIKRFSGGGFDVVLQEQARKFVLPDASEKVDVKSELPNKKGGESELKNIKEREPTALTFELGREDFYEHSVIEKYLQELETLRYVVFTDGNNQFEGYAAVGAFSRLLENLKTGVVDEIETREITNHAVVRTNSIRSDSTNKECLQEMDNRDIDELAVVNTQETFVGVITQDAIIRTLINSILSEV